MDMIGRLKNAFRMERDQIFKKRGAFQRQKEHFKEKKKRDVSGRAGRYGCYDEGFSDSERVLKEKAAFLRGCRDVSDKEGVHKGNRGWKDESFSTEVETVRQREKKI